MKTIKLGILGAAKILQQALIDPIKEIDEVIVVGIASSSYERAKKFARKHSLPKYYDHYQDLLNDKEIDAIYIALGNDQHTEWIVKAAQAGKHILVEKPVCFTALQFDKIEQSIITSGVILHEAIMTRHHPWHRKVNEIIQKKEFGNLQQLTTYFTYQLNPETRSTSHRLFPERGGGCLFDNAPYWLQLVQNCTDQMPCSLNGVSDFDGINEIALNFEANLDFENGLSAKLIASYDQPLNARHELIFEEAVLTVPNFLRPSYGQQKFILKIDQLNSSKRIIFDPENYYKNQIEHFVKLIKGEIEHEPLSKMSNRVLLMDQLDLSARSKQLIKLEMKDSTG